MKLQTILVVEDNELNMKLVRDILKIGKYNVIEAMDAESGSPASVGVVWRALANGGRSRR